jgi:hypothetical protein
MAIAARARRADHDDRGARGQAREAGERRREHDAPRRRRDDQCDRSAVPLREHLHDDLGRDGIRDARDGSAAGARQHPGPRNHPGDRQPGRRSERLRRAREHDLRRARQEADRRVHLGHGASAAYWIASAADEVVVAPTAIVGSIGAVMAISDRTKADEARGVSTIEIVSSQSPKKRLSPTSAEGSLKSSCSSTTWRRSSSTPSRRIAASALIPCSPISARAECSSAPGRGDAGLADRVGSYEQLQASSPAAPMSCPNTRRRSAHNQQPNQRIQQ